MKKNIKKIRLSPFLIIIGLIMSCEEEKIADVGQLPDLTPPVSSFSISNTSVNDLGPEEKAIAYQYFDLIQTSISSTDYRWSIPANSVLKDINDDDNNPPSLEDPGIRVQFPGPGTFEVSLESTDKLLKSDVITREINVIEPADEILPPALVNPSFEKDPRGWTGWDPDNVNGTTLDVGKRPGESGDSADNIGGSLKFNPNDNRVAVQVVNGFIVGQEYSLVYNYSIKSDSGTAKLRVLIIPDAITSESQIDPNGPGVFFKLGETSLGSSSKFTQESLRFIAQSSELTLYFSGTTGDGSTNISGDSDLRLDDISLKTIQF